MSEKEVTDWLVGIGTIILAVVAIFQDHIRGFIYRPKLSTSMKTAPPDCMAVPAYVTRPSFAAFNDPSDSPVNALYLRLLIANTGNATALNVEVYAHVQIPQHAGPGFHVMSGRYSTACRATVPRQVGPVRER